MSRMGPGLQALMASSSLPVRPVSGSRWENAELLYRYRKSGDGIVPGLLICCVRIKKGNLELLNSMLPYSEIKAAMEAN